MGEGQQRPPEGMHLQHPEAEWRSSPTAPRVPASITRQLNSVGDGVGGGNEARTVASPTHVTRPGPAPPPFLGRGQSLGRSRSLRPPVRGCGGPRRQEEKEEAASLSAHPTPTSGPRGPANRMEVEAGRTGSARQHGPGAAWPAGG